MELMQLPVLSKTAVGVMLTVVAATLGIYLYRYNPSELLNPGGTTYLLERPRPYAAYTFEALAARPATRSPIEVGRELKQTELFTSHIFYYTGDGRRISGMMVTPTGTTPEGGWPVIVMARGYVEKQGYQTGIGTRNAAEYYASRGFMTLAPDFAGYGESDSEDENALGARLRKPVEMLDLIASLASMSQIDRDRVYLWGHSNGGQIMLSVAEIWGKKGGDEGVNIRGLTMWAPVSKPFPYNILFYTDEADDKGKWLRHEIAIFESLYDVYQYSIDRYWDEIKIPILLHQGTADIEVPRSWSDELVSQLEDNDKEVTYHLYPGADHNMRPAWETVVARDISFFNSLD